MKTLLIKSNIVSL